MKKWEYKICEYKKWFEAYYRVEGWSKADAKELAPHYAWTDLIRTHNKTQVRAPVDERLAELGKNGWECFSVVPNEWTLATLSDYRVITFTYFFRRSTSN